MGLNINDKQALAEFLQNECVVTNGEEAKDMCLALFANLGSTDAQLRDGLTTTILAKLIMNEPSLEPTHLAEILLKVIDDEHLFYRIGETGTDSVFMRTFSILVVAAVFERDKSDALLTREVVNKGIEAVLRYALEEKDKRGYVQGKGWAHSVAHTSDAIDGAVQHQFATVEQRDEALDALRHLVMTDDYLVHDEDARLAFTVFRMMQFDRVDYMILEDWLQGFAEKTYDAALEPSPAGWNAQNFLRRLYLRLKWTGVNKSMAEHVSAILRSVDSLAVLE